ncbi:MAG: GNAT family N-acetyltransferase [Phototrophicaceae bacterium]
MTRQLTLHTPQTRTDGLRPVNLQTDLADLADLIETAFSHTMDTGGRAAVREMRQLSHLGLGLGLLSRLNDLAQGMSLGYVWVADGKVVGNVSIFPADLPREFGKSWIIANVAVYAHYRRRGIAKHLMHAALDLIRTNGGRVYLQVDYDNEAARHLYRSLGFIEERVWTQWKHTPYRSAPNIELPPEVRVTQRRLGDVYHEQNLAEIDRPPALGGLDWLKPSHESTFRLTPAKRLSNWLALRDQQRLVVRGQADHLLGWLQIESSGTLMSRNLTLMTHPDARGAVARALLGLVMRRFGRDMILMNHPQDDSLVNEVLIQYEFQAQRTVMHMRLEG